jgi:hypothetical protein
MKVRVVRIDGDSAFIPLTKGYEAVIDANDVALISAFNWQANVKACTIYAQRGDRSTGKKRSVILHRVIMGNPAGREIDHINGNGLDNRRSNLRVVTRSENMQNQRKARADNKSSGLLGVSWHKPGRNWTAQITIAGKRTHLGIFDTSSEAHAAYLSAKRNLHDFCVI